jgi:hypothetical protein
LKDFGGSFQLVRNGQELGPTATDDEKKMYSGYYLKLPEENAYLYFNYYKDLLRVKRLRDPLGLLQNHDASQ